MKEREQRIDRRRFALDSLTPPYADAACEVEIRRQLDKHHARRSSDYLGNMLLAAKVVRDKKPAGQWRGVSRRRWCLLRPRPKHNHDLTGGRMMLLPND
jgi:hypothetical protein